MGGARFAENLALGAGIFSGWGHGPVAACSIAGVKTAPSVPSPVPLDRVVVPPETLRPGGVACLNCGAPLTGPFCAACGQRDVPPYPSVRDLVVDAFWELSGWDGRFASTVRALVQQPGLLTREFLEGRRARYISPLRLYLMASLVYFVLAAAAPAVSFSSGLLDGLSGRARAGSPGVTFSRPERVGAATRGALTADAAVSPAERAAALADVERAPAPMRPFLRRALGDSKGFKQGIVATMPRMLFALLPIFAGIIALFYRGRKYPEHLYFAIHLHAFLFLALAASALLRFVRLPLLAGVVGGIALLWIPVYATLAFRRVYGGSVVRTLAKEAVIAAIYGITSLVAFIAMVYWVSIAG